MWLDHKVHRLYHRMGPHYPLLWGFQVLSSVFIAIAAIVIISSFYDATAGELALLFAISGTSTTFAIVFALSRQRAGFQELIAWRDNPDPSDAETVAAWDTATNLTLRSYRSTSLLVNLMAAIPSVTAVLLVLDLPWHSIFVLLLAAIPPTTYGTVLNYAQAELLMRPLIEHIAMKLPDSFEFSRDGLPVTKRLLFTLPVFTGATGVVVAAIVSDGGGTDAMFVAAVASMGIGVLLSSELGLMLIRSITQPISELREALARVQEGDLDVRVPVISSDELGELSDDFNKMVAGLAEREQIREAFGTYVDNEIAEILISGRFPAEGVAVDVSVMFCDVPGFTAFAEGSDPREVVAALNELFERTVPIIDRHGGHVDKFLGDGLLAVFGAPEGFEDHADRAVAAGLEIVADGGGPDDGLELRVGINSGELVAGSIGGAGRLNFSVIGDVVNVAARVEAATRQTGDSMLITAATRDALKRPVVAQSRGSIELKGKSEPCEVLAVGSGVVRSQPESAVAEPHAGV